MRVFVTGATGFVGRALVQRCLGAGYEVTALVRNAKRARDRLGPDVELCLAGGGHATWVAALSQADAVINLAGESVLTRAWTAARKRALRSSRVALTTQLVAAIGDAQPRPRVLVSTSAVGYYGDSGAEPLIESSRPGDAFLARLCVEWEAAALAARSHGLRVAVLRLGIVLGQGGGALAAMLPAFRLGLGGPLGSGDQFVPWIHLDDVLDIVLRAVTDERYQGALNVSGPEPLTSREFGATLGAAVRMPAKLGAPRFALQLLLGERAQVTLQSQRTLPAALEGLGYRFRHASLAEALRAILGVADRVRVRRASPSERKDLPTRPAYVLEHRSELRTPLAETFAFFCKAENLGLITPDWMRFEMLGAPAQSIQAGTELDYKIGLGPLPMRWKTVISRWSPPSGFVDNQARGPYSLWWHEHSLEAHGGGTSMLDRVYYTPPFGLLGRLVHALFIRRMLRAIFAYRAEATERLFGTPRLS